MTRISRYLITLAVASMVVPCRSGAGPTFSGSVTPGGAPASRGISPTAPTVQNMENRFYLATEEERPAVLSLIRALGTEEALALNLKLLGYPDVKVRIDAAESLRQWGKRGYEAAFRGMDVPEINWICEAMLVETGPPVVVFLTEMTEHKESLYRARAVYLLGRIGDPVAFGPLYARLKDPSREVRIQAIQALSEMGNPEALTPILDLFDTEDVGMGDFVLQAAERFGVRAARFLEVALGSKKERVRSGAAMALGRIRVPESLPHLVKALDDPSVSVRRTAALALGNYRDMTAAPGLIRALSDPDLDVQEYASSGLAGLSPDVLPELVGLMKSRSAQVRKNAIITMRKSRDSGVFNTIVQALDDPDPNVRMFAVTALIEFKDPRALKPLIHRLKREKNIAWLLSYAFMEMGNDAVDELLSATGDEEFCYARNTILLQMGNDAIEVLIRRALTDQGPSRLNAVAVLGELASPEALPVLGDLLREEEVGWVAAQSLARIGKPAWDVLYNNAKGSNDLARANALNGLSRIEDPSAYVNLVDCLGDRDPQVRRATAEAVIRAGKDVVMLVAGRIGEVPDDLVPEASEVLCRVSDMAAIDPLSRVLFPEPWGPEVIRRERLQYLRQAYIQKGSIEVLRKRLRQEMGSGGGGGPWERVAQ